MDADKVGYNALKQALIYTISDYLDRSLPLRRISLVASLLRDCETSLSEECRLKRRILSEQKSDGGWVDCEDTAWSLCSISGLNENHSQISKGLKWLCTEKSLEGGWGFCKRDKSCIPISAQILYFLSEFSHSPESMLWLENEWQKDLAAPVTLNYKAAWYLLAYTKFHSKINLSAELFKKTLAYLAAEQREDGSWGPWRTHPAPSDYFITGICMGGIAVSYPLLNEPQLSTTLDKGIRWILNNQMRNGLFPTHYIEEGSAWIFFGWSKANKIIKNR